MKSVSWDHHLRTFAALETLNERIGDFAALVALVLVLVTLFTSQRSSHIEQMRHGTPQKGDWTTEIWLNAILAIFTLGLFLTGLPLVIESAEEIRRDGPLHGAFVLVWLLLIVLVVWQVSLAVAGRDGRKTWEAEHGATNRGGER